MRRPGCLMLAASLAFASATSSQECFDYGTLPDPILGTYVLDGDIAALDASSDALCLVIKTPVGALPPTSQLLTWYEIADGSVPVWKGELALPNIGIRALRMAGQRVVVTLADGSWCVIDFADPAQPAIVGAVGPGPEDRDAVLVGDLVLTGSTDHGLGIYELLGDGTVVERNRLPLGTVRYLAVDGDRCWITGNRMDSIEWPPLFGYEFLALLDIADPASPSEIGRLEEPSEYEWIVQYGAPSAAEGKATVVKGRAYYDIDTDTFTGYRDVDFYSAASFPPSGVSADFQVTAGTGTTVLDGSWAYMTNEARFVRYFHHDGDAWREIGVVYCDLRRFAVSDAAIWIGRSRYLHALVKELPQESPYLGPVYRSSWWVPRSLHSVDGHLAAMVRYLDEDVPPFYSLLFFADADPPALTPLGNVSYFHFPEKFAIEDRLIYTRTGIWDWSTRSQVGSIPVDWCLPLAVIEGTLWAGHSNDILVFELADPVNPTLVSTVLPNLRIEFVVNAGRWAVLANYDRLMVADITDPAAPDLLPGWWPIASPLRDLVVQDGQILMTDAAGLTVLALEADGTLSCLGNLALTSAHGLAFDPPIVYVAQRYAGILAVDISDPSVPTPIATVGLRGDATSVAIHGGFLYVNNDGIHALQLHCHTTTPVILQDVSLAWADGACRLTWLIAGDMGALRVLASVGNRRWVVPWRVEQGTHVAVDREPRPGETVFYAIQTLVDGAWVTVAEQSIAVPVPPLALQSAVPNPFNPSTTLRFTLDRPGPVDLAVYDVTGRKVCTLVAGELPAGAHDAVWHGVAAGGRTMPSGVYLARLRTASGERSVRLTLVK
jgi:hypothetical protein